SEVLEKIWADWEKFASYAFNKSHATCYSWVAYQTAYLKAHYPAEYMAGVMSRNLSAADKLSKIMDECKRMGLSVKGPDINESGHKFSVTKQGEIRFGLSGIKSVGDSAVNAIVKERKANGPYKDIYDFVERVNLSACNRGSIESLALAGAFDSFGIPREMLVAPVFDSTYADQLVKYGQNVQNDANSLQASLFADLEPIETNKPPYPEYEPWNRLKLLDAEKNLVTMYLSAHPLDPYYMELSYGCNTTCEEFETKVDDGMHLTLGGMVVSMEEKMSKKGKPFGIVTLEDFRGKTQIRLFGRAYEVNKSRFVTGDAVYVEVKCQASTYNPSFIDMNFEKIVPLEQMKG
ncbi:MAG: DNA polymerase III subunit alpha, partial [Muribaculaceae bacterium]|nr:DNA polymerase III subunit alpha [Muribaculaceae bacterium]